MEKNTTPNEKKDFFISYNKADEEWAVWIAYQLEANGYTTIIQAWDFKPGNNFIIEMDRASRETKRTICVLSPSYFTSNFTPSEWAAAFVQDPKGENRKIIPIRVRPFEQVGLLASIVYIDLVDKDENSTKRTLLEGVQDGRAKPNSPPKFPLQTSKADKIRFPGTLPSLWNVPFNRNPHFTGRDSYMEALNTTLHSGKYTALTQAITGLGGIGKTQIAIEYSYRFASEYDIVWWIRAEDRTTLLTDFLNLGNRLPIDQYESSEQKLKISLIRRWLETHSNWLLIFDNAQDLKDLYDPLKTDENLLPQVPTGHILITSRNPNWSSLVHSVNIQLFSNDEAIEFLQKRTGFLDETGASDLAKELGYLPLALEQAAAYIVETPGMTFQTYLKIFKERHNQLWATEKPPINYPDTVATTWSLSIDRIKKENTDSADLLNLCAFFAPDDIPTSILKKLIGDDLRFAEMIKILKKYSLIDATAEKISVHRLVQLVTRDHLNKRDRKTWISRGICLLNDVFIFHPDIPETWLESSRIVPHILSVTTFAEEESVDLKLASQLLGNTSIYLQFFADYTRAQELVERALQIAENIYGPDGKEVATLLNNLGLILKALGKFTEAKALLERALQINNKTLRPDSEGIATTANNLGLVLYDIGDLREAKVQYERAITICEKLGVSKHPEISKSLNNLGRLLHRLGDYAGAIKKFEQALEIDKKVYGDIHPDVARDFNNLALVLQDKGDPKKAKETFEQSLQIYEQLFDQNHPEIATSRNNLGRVLQDLGDYQGAKKQFEKALEITINRFGPMHPEVALIANNLGVLFQIMDDLPNAKKQVERALEIDEKFYGSNHIEVATDLNNLGTILTKLGDFPNAKIQLVKALKIVEEHLGPNHPYAGTTMNNLGGVLIELGDFSGAIYYLKRGLRIYEEKFGPDNIDVAKGASKIAEANLYLGEFEEARKYLTQSHKIFLKQLGPQDEYTQGTMEYLIFIDSHINRGETP
jgi:tetratricopeptide (TPR) repeat protein